MKETIKHAMNYENKKLNILLQAFILNSSVDKKQRPLELIKADWINNLGNKYSIASANKVVTDLINHKVLVQSGIEKRGEITCNKYEFNEDKYIEYLLSFLTSKLFIKVIEDYQVENANIPLIVKSLLSQEQEREIEQNYRYQKR